MQRGVYQRVITVGNEIDGVRMFAKAAGEHGAELGIVFDDEKSHAQRVRREPARGEGLNSALIQR